MWLAQLDVLHLLQPIYFLIQWEHFRLKAYNWQILRLDPKSTTCSGYEETIRTLNHLLYISFNQSHRVKTSYINCLSKSFVCFLVFVRTVTLRLMSTRNCYYTCHLCQARFDSPCDRPTFTNTSTRYTAPAQSGWTRINTRFHSLSNDWPASSVQPSPNRARSSSNADRRRLLWTMRLWTFIWRRHLRKNTIKRGL